MAQNKEEVKIIHEMFPENQNYASILDAASLLTSRVWLCYITRNFYGKNEMDSNLA